MSASPEWKQLMKYAGKHLACTLYLARRYVTLHPRNATGWMMLGETLSKFYRYDEAHKALKKAIRYSSEVSIHFGYQFMGEHYMRKGSLRTAEKWFRKAHEANPGHNDALLSLGECLHLQEKTEEAKTIFRQLIRRKSAQDMKDVVCYHLGCVLRAEERYKEALKYFQEALTIDPKYKCARIAAVDMEKCLKPPELKTRKQVQRTLDNAQHNNEYAFALQIARNILDTNPQSPVHWVRTGMCLAGIGRFSEAQAAYRKALQLDNSGFFALSSIGHYYCDRRSYRQAEQCFRKAMLKDSSDVVMLIDLADALLRQGRISEAEQYLQQATQDETLSSADEAYDKLAFLCFANEQYDKANEHWQKVLQHNPECKSANKGIRNIQQLKKHQSQHEKNQ